MSDRRDIAAAALIAPLVLVIGFAVAVQKRIVRALVADDPNPELSRLDLMDRRGL